MGPIVAMFGREIQQYLLEHKDTNKIPQERMQFSTNSGRTSMGRRRMDKGHTEPVYVPDDQDDDRISVSSKRTRSPRRDPHRHAPWNQSPSNRQDIDLRSQGSQRHFRDIREDPNYPALKESLSRPRREDYKKSRDHTPQDEHPRGSMSSRDYKSRQDYKSKEHKPRQPNYPCPHDDEDDRRSRRG